jgi:Protein of unknown function (DUF2905)
MIAGLDGGRSRSGSGPFRGRCGGVRYNLPAMTDPATASHFGRLLLAAGIVLAAAGLYLILGQRLPPLGRLPGDIVWNRNGVRIDIPIVTCLILSAALTILSAIISHFRR